MSLRVVPPQPLPEDRAIALCEFALASLDRMQDTLAELERQIALLSADSRDLDR